MEGLSLGGEGSAAGATPDDVKKAANTVFPIDPKDPKNADILSARAAVAEALKESSASIFQKA